MHWYDSGSDPANDDYWNLTQDQEAMCLELIQSNPTAGPGERYDLYLLRRFGVLDPIRTSIRDTYRSAVQRWYIQDDPTYTMIGWLEDNEEPIHQDGYTWILRS